MKTIQQILEEERTKSQLNNMSDGYINRAISNRMRAQDPIQEEQRISALLEVMQTDDWKRKQIENGKIISEKYNADMEHRKKALKEGWDKPGVRENKSVSAKEAASRPEVRKKLLKNIQERSKKQMVPVVTKDGIFCSVLEWSKFVGKSTAMFGHWANKFPNEYYRISQEEYIMLTGQDPFQ